MVKKSASLLGGVDLIYFYSAALYGGASEGGKRSLSAGRGRQCDFIKTRHFVKPFFENGKKRDFTSSALGE